MTKVADLFYIESGDGLSLNKMDQSIQEVCFVSRTTRNNGVSAMVKELATIAPFKSGLITVALSGNGILQSSVQPFDFYTGYHVAVLTPRRDMTILEKLYYCSCIRTNRYKYSYGRQANRTLLDLEIPSTVPPEFLKINENLFQDMGDCLLDGGVPLNIDTGDWEEFFLQDLFEIESGRGALIKQAEQLPGLTPLVSATRFNNGISLYTELEATHKGNSISLVKNGNNVGKALYQSNPFISTSDMAVLTPKFELNVYVAMFLITLIEKESFRYNYGRKFGTKLIQKTKLKLPIQNGKPDWATMEDFIKKIRFSKSL